MEFKLYVIRHGETGHNKSSIIQGQLDIPLSENGINQAKLLAKTLQNIKWNEVWTSDLKRAWQTANFILHHMDKNDEELMKNEEFLVQKPLPTIFTDARLRERNYGVAQGQSVASLQNLAKMAQMAVVDFVPPEAESTEDVRKRMQSFFNDLCARRLLDKDQKEDVSIMMVGHGGWLIQFMSYLASHESFCSNSSDAKVLSRLCPNTGVSQFEIRLGNNGAVSDIKCLSVHDRAHLNTTSIFCQDFAV